MILGATRPLNFFLRAFSPKAPHFYCQKASRISHLSDCIFIECMLYLTAIEFD